MPPIVAGAREDGVAAPKTKLLKSRPIPVLAAVAPPTPDAPIVGALASPSFGAALMPTIRRHS